MYSSMAFFKKKAYLNKLIFRGHKSSFLLLISASKLLTTFNKNFWELREKTYTFAPKTK